VVVPTKKTRMRADEEEQPKTEYFFDGSEEAQEHLAQDGKWKVTYANGDVFEGSYKDGKRVGQGTYTWKNGSVYIGDWVDGVKTGKAVWTYPDGSKYHGRVENGLRNGDGTFIYTNKDSYCGSWANGIRVGHGSYTYAADGSQLVGTWVNDAITEAKWYFPKPDKTVFQGTFSVDVETKIPTPKDLGLFVFGSGNQVTGMFEEGRFVQKGLAA